VEPFAYDWRQPLVHGEDSEPRPDSDRPSDPPPNVVDDLATLLGDLLEESNQPVRLLAHGSGGLLIRALAAAHKELWRDLTAREGARVLMLGTPHQGTYRTVETLLFHRSSRPSDLRVQIALLRGIAAGNSFRPHHRAYAQVSLAYRAAETGDLDLAQALVPLLETEATTLLDDPSSLRCRRRNRENRLKRLISCRSALYHLYLLLDQPWQLAAIAGWAHGLLPRLDFNRLPADVVLRLMSNYARCLCLQAPLAAPPGLPVPLVLLRRDLERLEQEAGRPRHHRSRAREDHLGFLRHLVAAIDHPLPMAAEGRSIAGADPLPPLAEDLLIVDTPLLRRCIAEYWRQAGQPPAAWPML
jgi:hypothetical protein